MIPKKDMVHGMYYKGICRGTYVAYWNGNEFMHLHWNFANPYVEVIKHFEDVKNTNTDGFIPVEEIKGLPREVYQKEREDAGY